MSSVTLIWLTSDIHLSCGAAVDSIRISSLILSETNQWSLVVVVVVGGLCKSMQDNDRWSPSFCPRGETVLCRDGMIWDSKHVAHAVNLSGGPVFREQIGPCLDGGRANVHWTGHWRTSQWSGIYLQTQHSSKAEIKRARKSLNTQLSGSASSICVPARLLVRPSAMPQWPNRTPSDPDRQSVRVICSWDLRLSNWI